METRNKSLWFNMPFLLGIVYIALSVGLVWSDVGELRVCTPGIYAWYVPVQIAAIFGSLFWLGYMAGKRKSE
jgi:hypothetical protein